MTRKFRAPSPFAVVQRRDMLTLICSLRRLRDRSNLTGPFERGMRAGFDMSAHIVWREWKQWSAAS